MSLPVNVKIDVNLKDVNTKHAMQHWVEMLTLLLLCSLFNLFSMCNIGLDAEHSKRLKFAASWIHQHLTLFPSDCSFVNHAIIFHYI